MRFLDAQTEKIDRAIAADRRVIALLEEFRTRLIADVVIGKLDVREAAERLPEEPAEDGVEAPDDEETTDSTGAITADDLEPLAEEVSP